MLHIGRDRVQLIDLRVDVCEASRRLRTAATTTPLAGKMADRLQEHRGPKCRDRQQKRRVRSFASADEIENLCQLPKRGSTDRNMPGKVALFFPAPDRHG